MRDKIAVFCSARCDIDPKYNEAARLFVRGAAALGFKIVSGGTVKGTMGEISDELEKCGGYHIGVVPRFMTKFAYPSLSELVWTDTLAERKAVFQKDTRAVVALPGGIGTLDEIIDTFSLLYLGKYDGKVCLLNYNGFYDPLLTLLQHYVDQKMMSEETLNRLVVAATPEELLMNL
jgi:uncharacterized protein (TIGR00730 family)